MIGRRFDSDRRLHPASAGQAARTRRSLVIGAGTVRSLRTLVVPRRVGRAPIRSATSSSSSSKQSGVDVERHRALASPERPLDRLDAGAGAPPDWPPSPADVASASPSRLGSPPGRRTCVGRCELRGGPSRPEPEQLAGVPAGRLVCRLCLPQDARGPAQFGLGTSWCVPSADRAP